MPYTGACGRFVCSGCQFSPSSNDTYMAFSVPRYSRPRRTGSSWMTVRVAQHAARNAVGDRLPRLAVIGGLVDERVAVVHLVEVDGQVGGARVVARRLDVADRAPRRQVGNVLRHVRPGLPAVARELHLAVVGAGPDQAASPAAIRRCKTTPAYSTPMLSRREAAGDCWRLLSLSVRSGLITCQLCPPSVVWCTCWLPT